MNKIKQKIVLFGAILGLVSGLGLAVVPASSVYAYTCAKSGDNNSGKVNGNDLQMEGNGASCFYYEQDQKDNSKKQPVAENGKIVPGKFTCTDGTVADGNGDCYTYKKTYSASQPTYDDGSKIDDQAFQAACQAQGTYYGSHYNYDPRFNACGAGLGCVGGIGDDGSDDSVGGGSGIPGLGDCRRLGADTKGAGDILGADPTAQKSNPSNPNSPNANNPATPTTPISVDDPSAVETFGSCGQHGTQDKDVKTVLIGCDAGTCPSASGGSSGTSTSFKGTPVIACVVKIFVSALTVLVGVGAVAGIAWEALKYARAQDNATLVQEARNRIRDIVIGIVAYVFMIVILNWLVPGGIIAG